MRRSVLVIRLLRARSRQVAGLLATAAVLSLIFAGVVLIRASSAAAVEESVSAGLAGRAFSVQVIDPRRALPVVTSRADLRPLWDTAGSLSTGSRSAPASVRRSTSADSVPELVVEGRQPQVPGEASVSAHVASVLGVDVGTRLRLTDEIAQPPVDVTITGLTVDPGRRGDATAVLVDRGQPVAGASVWITDTDPFADAGLRPLLDVRAISARTTELLAAEEGESAAGRLLAALRFVPIALAVLALCLFLAILNLLRREAKRDVDALHASGMKLPAAWRLMISASTVCLLAGSVVGALTGLLAGHLLRGPLSRPLDQNWQHVALPWGPVAAFAIGVPLAAAFLAVGITARKPSEGRPGRQEIELPRWLAPGVAAVGSAMLLMWWWGSLPASSAPIAGMLIVLGTPGTIVLLVARAARPATRRVIVHVSRSLTGLGVLVSLIALGTGYYAARSTHGTLAAEQAAVDTPLQPAGSLLLEGVNQQSRDTIATAYLRAGGRQFVDYLLPAEPVHTLRVTGPQLVKCMASGNHTNPDQVDSSCFPQRTMAPINIIALTDSPGQGDTITAEPGLMDNGVVGLLDFSVATGKVNSRQIVRATADPNLGGNLPGGVVGVDSALARQFDLKPSGARMIGLLDFSSLPETSQAELRGTISRVASAARIAEDSGFDDGGQRALGNAVAIGGTGVLTLLLASAGLSFLSSQRRFRGLLADIGLPRRRRLVLAMLLTGIPAGSLGITLVITRLTAWISSVHDGSGFGWIWALPAVVGLAVCAGLTRSYSRIPQPDR